MWKAEVRLYADGAVTPFLTLSEREIVRLRAEQSLTDGAFPLGAAVSARYTLEFDAEKAVPGLTGARARAVLTDGEGTQVPFGVWDVREALLPEDGATCTLRGADAMSGSFEAGFTDSANAYPQTLRDLMQTLCGAALQAPLSQREIANGASVIRTMPEWGEGATLRTVLGHAAFAAGSFARIGPDGKTEIVGLGGGETHTAGPGEYCAFTAGEGESAFNAILYRHEGQNVYTRYARDAAICDTPLTALRAEGNPLMNASRLNALTELLSGCGWQAGEAILTDRPELQAGDRLTLTDRAGARHELMITSLRAEYAGGSVVTRAVSALPQAAASGGKKLFNADGSIAFEAIGSAPQKVMALSKAYIDSLTAADITADGLLAKLVEAARLRAGEIDAGQVETDGLTAAAAEIVRATVRKIEAGTVRTDELMTGLVNALSLKAEQLTAGDLTSDRLGAALARIGVLIAGNARFDRASVTHLVSEALQLSYGTGDSVFIRNLAADYAAMVTANVGSLCVKAADGNFYELIADPADGSVRAQLAGVTQQEQQAGRTESGRLLIESAIDVSELNASTIKGVCALINRLDAARLDVDTLYAREAFISRLNAQDITANRYLRIALEGLREEREEDAPFLEGLKRYLSFDENGLTQGREDSAYSTLVNESGFHIRRRSSVSDVGAFDQNGLNAPGMRIGRIRARGTVRGGWVFDWEE